MGGAAPSCKGGWGTAITLALGPSRTDSPPNASLRSAFDAKRAPWQRLSAGLFALQQTERRKPVFYCRAADCWGWGGWWEAADQAVETRNPVFKAAWWPLGAYFYSCEVQAPVLPVVLPPLLPQWHRTTAAVKCRMNVCVYRWDEAQNTDTWWPERGLLGEKVLSTTIATRMVHSILNGTNKLIKPNWSEI